MMGMDDQKLLLEGRAWSSSSFSPEVAVNWPHFKDRVEYARRRFIAPSLSGECIVFPLDVYQGGICLQRRFLSEQNAWTTSLRFAAKAPIYAMYLWRMPGYVMAELKVALRDKGNGRLVVPTRAPESFTRPNPALDADFG
jgi:hypothetical protein